MNTIWDKNIKKANLLKLFLYSFPFYIIFILFNYQYLLKQEINYYPYLLILGSITSVFLLLKNNISLYLGVFFIFFGTLFSVDIGFTLKVSQLLFVFSFVNIIIRFLIKYVNREELDFNKVKTSDFFLFILFFIMILPSIGAEKIFSNFYTESKPIRFLFNYLLLQIMFVSIFISINTKNKVKKVIVLTLLSYLFVLFFGFFQQIGYYLGFYNPIDYIGKHSTFVDFYGPFLRISPATFANEFGEILQSSLIFLTSFLIFMKKSLSKFKTFGLKIVLFLSIFALLINFTRVSWLVYLLYLITLFIVLKIHIFKRSIILMFVSLITFIFYYINSEYDILNLVSFIDRISELSNISENSAGMRLATWEESYKLFLKHPIIGNGWGTTIETHNVPLELLSEVGIIGFTCFYFLMFYLVRKFYKMIFLTNDNFLKTTSISLFFTLIGCLIFDLTNHGIYHFILWLTIGLGLAVDKIIKNNNSINNLG